MKNSILSRAKSYVYLKPCAFDGVNKIPPAVGASHDRWSFNWVGIHPKSPYLQHRINLCADGFERHFTNASHELRIEKQCIGSADRRLLYVVQLDLSGVGLIEQSTTDAMAEQIACAMVLFLLKLRDPGRCPGVLDVPHGSQQSGWAIALRETLQGLAEKSASKRIYLLK